MRSLKSLEDAFNNARRLAAKDKNERSIRRRHYYLWRDKVHKKIQERHEKTAEQPPLAEVEPIDSLLQRIRQYSNNDEIDELKYLAYTIAHSFSDRDTLFGGEEVQALRKILYAPFSEVADLAKALIHILEAHPDIRVYHSPALPPLKNRNSLISKVPYWQPSEPQQDSSGEDYVTISHGGGYFYILEFLTGRHFGYQLEKPGFGIQVTPVESHRYRNKGYAIKAQMHCDQPAVLTARIKRKYLDRANNAYEAGLRQEFIDLLEDISLNTMTAESEYPELWSKSPALAKIAFSSRNVFDLFNAKFELKKQVIDYIREMQDKTADPDCIESAFVLSRLDPLLEDDIKLVLAQDSVLIIDKMFNKITKPEAKAVFLQKSLTLASELPASRCYDCLITLAKRGYWDSIRIEDKNQQYAFGSWLDQHLDTSISLAIHESNWDRLSSLAAYSSIKQLQTTVSTNNILAFAILRTAKKAYSLSVKQIDDLIEQAIRSNNPSMVEPLLELGNSDWQLSSSVPKILDIAVDTADASIIELAIAHKQYIKNYQLMSAVTKIISDPRWRAEGKNLSFALEMLCSAASLNKTERLAIANALAKIPGLEDFTLVFNALKASLNISTQSDLFALLSPLSREQRQVVYSACADKIPDLLLTTAADNELLDFMPKIDSESSCFKKEYFAHQSTEQEQQAIRIPLLAFKLALSAGPVEDIKRTFNNLIDLANANHSRFEIRSLTSSSYNIIASLIQERSQHPLLSQALGIDRIDEKTLKNYVKRHTDSRKNASSALIDGYKQLLDSLKAEKTENKSSQRPK